MMRTQLGRAQLESYRTPGTGRARLQSCRNCAQRFAPSGAGVSNKKAPLQLIKPGGAVRFECYCTVNEVEVVIPFAFAPIVVVPTPLVVATPATLGAFAIVATLAEDELK